MGRTMIFTMHVDGVVLALNIYGNYWARHTNSVTRSLAGWCHGVTPARVRLLTRFASPPSLAGHIHATPMSRDIVDQFFHSVECKPTAWSGLVCSHFFWYRFIYINVTVIFIYINLESWPKYLKYIFFSI